jgi:mRNA interferase RelE/StbE
MEVIITKGYIKDLKFLPKEVVVAADEVIDLLTASKSLQDSGVDYKKLSGQKKTENYYRIRVGNYRIGCQLIQPTIILITIFSRQDDYKGFP